MKIPVMTRGRQSKATRYKYSLELQEFAQHLKSFQKDVDFKISARGWCYQLESFNAIDKSQFDLAENKINECRKNGMLPIDFTASDQRRVAELVPSVDSDTESTLQAWKSGMINSVENHTPHLLSDQSNKYIEVLVEKVDLKGLFRPVCEAYQIPITNVSGWSDINSRAALLTRCEDAHYEGKEVHLLYCGDFDPGGLQISNTFMKNLKDLEEATGINPDFINFNRFGLNYDYIVDNALVWTDNLMTGSKSKNAKPLNDPRHKNHFDAHVQDYLELCCDGGANPRKVEANALLKDIDSGRQMLQSVINDLVSVDELNLYEKSLIESRLELKKAFENLWKVA